MLGSADYVALYAVFFQHFFELRNDGIDKPLPLLALLIDVGDEIFVGFGFEIFKTKVLQLALDLRNTKPVGKRREYAQRFLGDALLPLVGKII